jgi:predicted Zn-dependent protease
MKIKKLFLVLIILTFSFSSLARDFDSPLFKALEDELKRNIENLKLENEKPPYFISYRVLERERVNITSSFGAIVKEKESKDRVLFIDLRVGDPNFDNSNFVSTSEPYGNIRSAVRLPLEDDYDSIREAVWLATDEMYKNAIDTLAKKKSTLAHREVKEQIPDFTTSVPFKFSEEIKKISIDKKVWRENLKRLSSILRSYPEFLSSRISFSSSSIAQYYIDSDGNKNIRNDLLTSVEVFVDAITADGLKIKDYISFHARFPEELPNMKEMEDRIKEMADEIRAYSIAPVEKEYSGPILFLPPASCEFFYHTLAKGVSDARKPFYEFDRLKDMREENRGFLSPKIGKMVMPSFFNAWCDPTQTSWNNRSLIGKISVDDQGVKSEKIEVIKNGKLVNIPLGRTPVKEKSGSNGHGRYLNGSVVGFVSNLFVESEKTSEDIERDFIQLLKERGLEFGIVIKRLNPQAPLSYEELIEQIYTLIGKKKEILPPPFICYKLYTDGRKEYVRGLKFEGVTLATLQDILMAGKDKEVYNLLVRDSFQSIYERLPIGAELPVSIVAPSIVVDRMVLTFLEEKAEKKPYLKNPFFEKGQK